MARPKKTGLDFYYRDVDFLDDYRVMQLINQYGAMGYMVLDVVVSRIYKNGYYLEIPLVHLAAQVIRLIGNRWISDPEQIIEMIRYCGEVGIFDKGLLEKSVITSVDIQRHYSYVSARRTVDKSKYWLIEDPSDDETPDKSRNKKIIAAETPVIAAIIPQSKANERKVNEMKAAKAAKSKADEIMADGIPDAEILEQEPYSPEIIPSENTAAAAAAHNGWDDAHDADNADFSENPAASENSFSQRLDSAFFDVTGRHINHSDRRVIALLRKEGATDYMFEAAVREVPSRKHAKIRSFRYFIDMVREKIAAQSHMYHSLPHSGGDEFDCELPVPCLMDQPQQGTSTREIDQVLDMEFHNWLSQPVSDDDFIYDDG